MLIKRSALSLETALFKGLLSLLNNSMSAKDELACVYWAMCEVCMCARWKELLSAYLLSTCFCFGGARLPSELRWHSGLRSSSSVWIFFFFKCRCQSRALTLRLTCWKHIPRRPNCALSSVCTPVTAAALCLRKGRHTSTFVWHHSVSRWFQSAAPPLLIYNINNFNW